MTRNSATIKVDGPDGIQEADGSIPFSSTKSRKFSRTRFWRGRLWQGLATIALLAACAPIEDIPSQVGDIVDGLTDCAELLTEAEMQACGEAVLDGFELKWECYCTPDDPPAWTVCGTREEAQAAVDGTGCTCTRVGFCE